MHRDVEPQGLARFTDAAGEVTEEKMSRKKKERLH